MSFRIGDTTNSLKNRKQFLSKNGIAFQNHICMKCDHREKITVITKEHHTQYFGAQIQKAMLQSEVLVTQEKNIALMLLTADCIPASFYDPVTQTIALAHFSRETIANMLPQKTIGFLREQCAIDPTNLMIHIGPHIHKESYAFHLPSHHIQPQMLPYTEKENNTIRVNLAGACTHQIIQAGISTSHITISEIDTYTSSNHFSHYRSTKEKTPEGRFATIIMMK